MIKLYISITVESNDHCVSRGPFRIQALVAFGTAKAVQRSGEVSNDFHKECSTRKIFWLDHQNVEPEHVSSKIASHQTKHLQT